MDDALDEQLSAESITDPTSFPLVERGHQYEVIRFRSPAVHLGRPDEALAASRSR